MSQAGWIETDSQDNAEAAASRSAPSDTTKQHVVFGAHASFSSLAGGLLQIKDGTTVIFEIAVVRSTAVFTPTMPIFQKGIAITPGNACSAVLSASGTGGTVGKVNLHGITR